MKAKSFHSFRRQQDPQSGREIADRPHPLMPFIVYLILASALILPLLGEGFYLSLDMVFGPNMYKESHFGDLYGSDPNPYGAYLPRDLVFAALSEVFPVEAIQKAFLFLILFLCGICMHTSLPGRLGSSRYFAGFLYTLNPFVFIRLLAGHGSFLLSYALWPLCLMLFVRLLEKPSWKSLSYAALATFAASISSHGLALLLIAYGVISIARALQGCDRALLFRTVAILGLLVLAMDLFWIVPVILMFGQTYSPVSADTYLQDFGAGGGLPLPIEILTMHGFWRGGFKYTREVFDLWYLPFLLIAILASAGFYSLLRKDRGSALALATIFSLGFLLALGPESPLSFILTQPIVSFAFRDSQKLVGLMCLGYAIFGAHGVNMLSERLGGKRRLALLTALLAIPFIYNFGFFGFLGQVGPTVYPSDWQAAEDVMAADGTPGSILVLPTHLYMGFPWINSATKTLANPAERFFSRPAFTAKNLETSNIYSDRVDPRGDYARFMFKNREYVDNTAEMLLPIDARYIILYKHDEDSIHYLYLFMRTAGVRDVELVFDGPHLYLFRDSMVQSPLFVTSDPGNGGFTDLLQGNRSYSIPRYESINPAVYRVDTCPLDTLVLAQPYSRFLYFGSEPSESWNGIANSFPCDGPGYIRNWLYPVNLALLHLSWLIVLLLIVRPPPGHAIVIAAILASLCIAAYALSFTPALIGALMLLSLAASAIPSLYRYVRHRGSR